MVKKLTLKQQKFVEKYVDNGGNAKQAALEVYDVSCDVNARNIGKCNLEKPLVIEAVQKKLASFKDGILNKVNELDSMRLAVASAHEDLLDDDPRIRDNARKFILEVSKFLTGGESKKEGSKHVHFEVPKFKG